MIKYFLRREDWVLARATSGASGFDLRYNGDKEVAIYSGCKEILSTGLFLEIPLGWEGQVRSRSGLAAKGAIAVLNSPGTIDSDYRGEVKVILINHGAVIQYFSPGDRIAQLVFSPVYVPDHVLAFYAGNLVRVTDLNQLGDTQRNNSGFGSTGVK